MIRLSKMSEKEQKVMQNIECKFFNSIADVAVAQRDQFIIDMTKLGYELAENVPPVKDIQVRRITKGKRSYFLAKAKLKIAVL